MHVISRRALLEFAASHADAARPLDAWFRTAQASRRQNIIEVQASWPSAEAIGGLTVFNVKGNSYRLITRIKYRTVIIFIRAILTHAEYDKGKWNGRG